MKMENEKIKNKKDKMNGLTKNIGNALHTPKLNASPRLGILFFV